MAEKRTTDRISIENRLIEVVMSPSKKNKRRRRYHKKYKFASGRRAELQRVGPPPVQPDAEDEVENRDNYLPEGGYPPPGPPDDQPEEGPPPPGPPDDDFGFDAGPWRARPDEHPLNKNLRDVFTQGIPIPRTKSPNWLKKLMTW